jgi:MFS family permease
MMTVVNSYGASILATFPGGTAAIAATIASSGNFGSLIAYYVLPPISERLGVKKPFVWVSCVPSAIFIPIAVLSRQYWIAAICIFTTFFFNGWLIPGPKSMTLESPGVAGLRAGTAVGMLTFAQYLGGAVVPFAYAGISESYSGGTAMSVVCITGAVLSIAFMLQVKETGMGREAAEKLYQEKKAAKLAAKTN